jgi:hypothetical protein
MVDQGETAFRPDENIHLPRSVQELFGAAFKALFSASAELNGPPL